MSANTQRLAGQQSYEPGRSVDGRLSVRVRGCSDNGGHYSSCRTRVANPERPTGSMDRGFPRARLEPRRAAATL